MAPVQKGTGTEGYRYRRVSVKKGTGTERYRYRSVQKGTEAYSRVKKGTNWY